MQAIATIKHNDPSRTDRVTLYRADDSNLVYAAADDETPYETDVTIDHISDAWGGPEWDLQTIE